MRVRSLDHPISRWTAVVVLLAGFLMPSLSRWFAADSPAPLAQICTAFGSHGVGQGASADDGRKGTAPAPAASLFDHGPCCTLHHTAPLLPTSLPALGLLPLTFELPVLFLAAPRTLYAWRSAQPRGPPVSN